MKALLITPVLLSGCITVQIPQGEPKTSPEPMPIAKQEPAPKPTPAPAPAPTPAPVAQQTQTVQYQSQSKFDGIQVFDIERIWQKEYRTAFFNECLKKSNVMQCACGTEHAQAHLSQKVFQDTETANHFYDVFVDIGKICREKLKEDKRELIMTNFKFVARNSKGFNEDQELQEVGMCFSVVSAYIYKTPNNAKNYSVRFEYLEDYIRQCYEKVLQGKGIGI